MHEGFEMPEFLKDRQYTVGVVASFTRNKGEVFVAGTCEWVHGLIKKDFFVETITRNVLKRFTSSK